MPYTPPPDPACSPVPLGNQSPGANNNFRAGIANDPAPYEALVVALTATPRTPSPTPTPNIPQNATLYRRGPAAPSITKTATQTATAATPINPVGYPGSVVRRGDRDTGLALPTNVYGPFPQTLFLGCSVANFNVSLGWGNQPSQLSVTLVEDTTPHYVMSHDGGLYKQAALGLQSSSNHYYSSLKPYKNAQGVVTENAESFRGRVAQFLDTNGNLIVPGKLFFKYNTSTGMVEQKYWLGPDPGFIGARNSFKRSGQPNIGTDPITGKKNIELGQAVDIIGCPVFFQFDDFNFCGILKSWKSVNSGTGGRTYQVDIEGPNEIVNQAQLILSNYAGGVYVKSTDSDGPEGKPSIRGPSNDLWSSKVSLPTAFKGNVSMDGNIPNIINIYGFLEAMAPGGFGGANINDMGIRTNTVIYALNYLLGLPVNNTSRPGQTVRSVFSTFGALVGRSPMSGTPPEPPKPAGQPMKIFKATDSDVPKAMNILDAVSYGGAGNPEYSFPLSRYIDRSKGGFSTSGTVHSFLEVGDDGSVHRNSKPLGASGAEHTIFDFGLLPPDDTTQTTVGGSDPVANQDVKQLYYLDLGELPVVPMQLRTDCSQSVMDLNAFITEICDKSGVDFFWEMLYIKVYSSMPAMKIIKLRTVSRRVQPSDRKISDYIAKLRDQNVDVSSVSLGKEYNSSAKPRTMLIGAKQQRLFQTKNYGLAYKASNYVYHTTYKRFIHYSDGGREHPEGKNENVYRIPNPGSVRDLNALNRTTKITRPNEIEPKGPGYFSQDTAWTTNKGQNSIMPVIGNYLKAGKIEESGSRGDLVQQHGAVAIVAKGGGSTSYSTSDQWIKYVGKALFDWAHPKFVDAANDPSLHRNLHSASSFWLTAPGGGSPWWPGNEGVSTGNSSGSSSSSSREAPTEQAVLDNFATAIADIGYNVYNRKPDTHYFLNRLKYLANKFGSWVMGADSTTRLFPIMYNSVSPFFGTVDYIDKTKTQYAATDKTKKPRPVWFDTWLGTLAIEFNVKELPITRLELQGIKNGGNFIVSESEIRAAMQGYDSWLAYMSMRIHDPDIKQMIKNAVCGSRVIPPAPQPTPQAKRRADEPAPQAANTGSTAATWGGQGANKPAQANTTSDWNVTSDNDWDACAIFCAFFKIETALNPKTKGVKGGTPKNRNAGLQSALFDDLKKLHEFFKAIGDKYYGKQFMVRLPIVLSYRDREAMINMDPRPTPTPAPNTANTAPASDPTYINLGSSDNPMYVTEGTGKIYSNYNISPDGAWEEYGNSIDDCLMVGGYAASVFTDDSGRIKPILGFPADDKFDFESYWACEWIKEHICKLVNGPNVFYYYDILKRSNALSNASRYTDFNPQGDSGGEPCS